MEIGGVIIGGVSKTYVIHELNRATHNYYSADFKTTGGKEAFKKLPSEQQERIKTHLGN